MIETPRPSICESSVGEGGAPPVHTRIGGSKCRSRAASSEASISKTVGAALKFVTSWRAILSRIVRGSMPRRQMWRPPAAVTAQGIHQPLQWKRGSVQRKVVSFESERAPI
jgi:hypothetical protein